MPRKILRILDANFNRSREGLRVCEEIARFYMESKTLSRDLKKARHTISAAWKNFPGSWTKLIAARDVHGDLGKKPSPLEKERKDISAVFLANAERVKESLRALEEFSKLIDPKISEIFKKVRFQVYAIEKRALPKLESLCDHLSRSASSRVDGRGSDRGRRQRRSVSR